MVFPTPPSGGRKPTAGRPVAARGPGPQKPPAGGRATKSAAGEAAGEAAEGEGDRKPKRRRPLQFAGLPIGVWIALAAGLIAVAVLGTMVVLRAQ